MQAKGSLPDGNCVPGIIASVVARNERDALRQQIHNSAFALISPLGSDNYI
jgi:hypothetical protein